MTVALQFRIEQIWPKSGRQFCEVIFPQALSMFALSILGRVHLCLVERDCHSTRLFSEVPIQVRTQT